MLSIGERKIMKVLSKIIYLLVLFCGLSSVNNLFGAYLKLAGFDSEGNLRVTYEYLKVDGDVVRTTIDKAGATRFTCLSDVVTQRPGCYEFKFGEKSLFIDDSGCFQLAKFVGEASSFAHWEWHYKRTWADVTMDYFIFEVQGCCRVLVRDDY